VGWSYKVKYSSKYFLLKRVAGLYQYLHRLVYTSSYCCFFSGYLRDCTLLCHSYESRFVSLQDVHLSLNGKKGLKIHFKFHELERARREVREKVIIYPEKERLRMFFKGGCFFQVYNLREMGILEKICNKTNVQKNNHDNKVLTLFLL
jgi:hypothetical protein